MTRRTATPWPFLLVLGTVSSAAHGFQGADEAALAAERDAAIEQVKRIVNEPVPALPLSPEAQVGMYRPGWFHQGALRPNFLTVDVRATQQFPYDQFEYVTSDLNPGVMFRGHDLEFNSMTKYFYTDYSVPKKRLSPGEMAEINRLYRVIGARERDIARLRAGPVSPPAVALGEAPAERKPTAFYGAAGALVLMLAIALYRVRAARS